MDDSFTSKINDLKLNYLHTSENNDQNMNDSFTSQEYRPNNEQLVYSPKWPNNERLFCSPK